MFGYSSKACVQPGVKGIKTTENNSILSSFYSSPAGGGP
jgi:hypothetical protein